VPLLLRLRGYEFRFFAGDGGEPPHVHVRGNSGRAKIWLARVEIAHSEYYSERRREEIIRITRAHRAEWLAAWARFFER
jgi:hypothetical protein